MRALMTSAFLLAACGPTEIVLDIDGVIVSADQPISMEGLDEVQIEMRHVSNGFSEETTIPLEGRWLPATVPIIHRSGPMGIYRIDVIGFQAGLQRIRFSRYESFQPNRSVRIPVVLANSCLDEVCDPDSTCSIEEGCIPIPGTDMLDGGVPFVDGGMTDGPDATDGGVDTGPVDTGPVDTGPVDTGPVDTGRPDMGVPDSGPPADTGVPGDDWFAGECTEAGSRCEDSCRSTCECDEDPCAVRCTSGCTVDCKNNAPCAVEIAAGDSRVICDGNCDVVIRDGASVVAECKNDSPCVLRCETGSTCEMDCAGDDFRCRIECAEGANCRLRECAGGVEIVGRVHRCRTG